MPPLKTTTRKSTVTSRIQENPVIKTKTTRSSKTLPNSIAKKENGKVEPFTKRNDISPIKGNILKEPVFGNITHATDKQCTKINGKKSVKKAASVAVTKAKVSLHAVTVTQPLAANVVKPNSPAKPMLPPLRKSRLTLPLKPPTVADPPRIRRSLRSAPSKPICLLCCAKPVEKPVPVAAPPPALVPANKCKITVKPKFMVNTVPNTRRSSGRRSTLGSSDGSLYVSALSDVLSYVRLDEDSAADMSTTKIPKELPAPLINIDEEYINVPFQCATYAYEIFEYLKSREEHFKIKEYMEMQTEMNVEMRAEVVDWMVETQENFELNHETLYLGVKLLDSYLSHIKVTKQSLQLVGAASLLIAAKYDERRPPAIKDLLYICGGAYKHREMITMEMNILKVVNFELGFPLSYRFLWRYSICSKTQSPLLDLASFILEYSLMHYTTVFLSDSKLAAAALYLAFKMKKEQEWDDTLIYFTGYRVEDFIDIVHILNNILHQKPKQSTQTFGNKYSSLQIFNQLHMCHHPENMKRVADNLNKVFYEVAKIPLVSNKYL